MTVAIHTYTASPEKFFVNSFIVESDTGLVLIDTQFLLSSARELAARIAAIGKPLDAIIVTHPHPDHFNGLPVILDAFGKVPVFANRPTIAAIAATQAAKRAAWTPIYGSDYPPTDALPDRELGPDETVTLAGVAFRVVDLGPGESADITVIHIPAADALIASDLVYARCHPWLAEHRTAEWLTQIDQVLTEFGEVGTIFAGHGPAGGAELLTAQRDYIESFRAIVAEHLRDGGLDRAAHAAIEAATTRDRAGWPLEMLIAMNATAMAEESAAT
jgi:glyoxylase-like metal-dependent hydrolase (beta-lactamase superfamily II)